MAKLVKEIPMEKLMSRQISLWERTHEKHSRNGKEKLHPAITISREIGSMGQELAEALSRRLHWKLFDKDLVEYIASDARVLNRVVETFDEKTQSEVHNFILTFLDRTALASDKYFKHLVTVMLSIARHGHAIILGRGGNFVLPDKWTLKLKIAAPMASRVDYVRRKHEVSEKQARQIVSRVDRERVAFISRFFHRNPEDPLYYDLVLNMGGLKVQTAEKIVIEAVRAKFPNSDIE